MALRSRPSVAAIFVLAALAACDQQPVSTAGPEPQPSAASGDGLPMNPPGREDAGFLSFTYSGDESGRYFAFGEADSVSGTTPMGDDFAAATHYYLGLEPRQDLGTAITSSARAQGGLSDGIHIQFPGTLQERTYNISTCGRGGGPFCPLINLVFDVDNDVPGGGTQTRYYSFTSGSITITSIEDGRITGAFQGTAVSTDGSTGETSTIVITDGRFDVPVTEIDSTQG